MQGSLLLCSSEDSVAVAFESSFKESSLYFISPMMDLLVSIIFIYKVLSSEKKLSFSRYPCNFYSCLICDRISSKFV